VADRLNQYHHFLRNPGYLANDLERYRQNHAGGGAGSRSGAFGAQRTRRVYGVPGDKVIQDVPRSERAARSAEAPVAAPSGQEWRQSSPAPGLASHLELPVPDKFRLSNGLTVYLLEHHNLPVVSANLILLCGSDRNPPQLPGLASFTAELLDEGTKHRSALEIAVTPINWERPFPPVRRWICQWSLSGRSEGHGCRLRAGCGRAFEP